MGYQGPGPNSLQYSTRQRVRIKLSSYVDNTFVKQTDSLGFSLPIANLAYVICFQEHLPEQTEEQGRKALHRELGNNFIFISH